MKHSATRTNESPRIKSNSSKAWWTFRMALPLPDEAESKIQIDFTEYEPYRIVERGIMFHN
jgi:hypothetical protein